MVFLALTAWLFFRSPHKFLPTRLILSSEATKIFEHITFCLMRATCWKPTTQPRFCAADMPAPGGCLLFRPTEDSVRRAAGGPQQVWADTRATLQLLSFVWIANIPEEPRDDRLHGHVDGAEGDPAVYINLCQSQIESSFRISTKKKKKDNVEKICA